MNVNLLLLFASVVGSVVLFAYYQPAGGTACQLVYPYWLVNYTFVFYESVNTMRFSSLSLCLGTVIKYKIAIRLTLSRRSYTLGLTLAYNSKFLLPNFTTRKKWKDKYQNKLIIIIVNKKETRKEKSVEGCIMENWCGCPLCQVKNIQNEMSALSS